MNAIWSAGTAASGRSLVAWAALCVAVASLVLFTRYSALPADLPLTVTWSGQVTAAPKSISAVVSFPLAWCAWLALMAGVAGSESRTEPQQRAAGVVALLGTILTLARAATMWWAPDWAGTLAVAQFGGLCALVGWIVGKNSWFLTPNLRSGSEVWGVAVAVTLSVIADQLRP